MSPSPNVTFAPFAVLPGAPASATAHRPRFADFFLAPFRDVDDRAARKTAAARAEREARLAMSGAVGQRP
jgi:hypothetical protein